MEVENVVSVSGGKDSLALWLLAIERETSGLRAVFADTGHEHPKTLEYIQYLSERVGPIQTIKADFSEAIARKREIVQTKWRLPEDEKVYEPLHQQHKKGFSKKDCKCRFEIVVHPPISEEKIERALAVLKPTGIPFLDMCLVKGRFPSTKARFCTEELKVKPIMTQVNLPLLNAGISVISWQGVRKDESRARANLPEMDGEGEWTNGATLKNYRPILDWTAGDCFEMAKKYGIKPNPLYLEGMGRVGCMPCINARKDELLEIGRRYPEEFNRVAEWESLVMEASKWDGATFYCTSDNHGHGIHKVFEWAQTSHGGKQFDIERMVEENPIMTCSSIYGLCE